MYMSKMKREDRHPPNTDIATAAKETTVNQPLLRPSEIRTLDRQMVDSKRSQKRGMTP